MYSESRVDTRAEDSFSGIFDLGFMTLTADEDMKSRRRARTELGYITAGAVLDLAPTFVWLGFEHGNRTVSTSLSPGTDVTITERGHDQLDRVYLHARTKFGPIVAEAEAGRSNERNEYGAAVRWQPLSGHAFGAEYQSKIRSFAPFTLEPVGLAGMLPDAAPAALGTRSKTLAFRWEGEFTPSFFMTAEVQRQNHEQLLAPAVDAFLSEVRSSPYLIESQYVFVGTGRVDRASLTANWLVTPNLALDVTGAATRSDQHNYLPRRYVRGQLVWNAPLGFKATISGTYFGNRRDDAADDGRPLDSATLVDLGLRWQSPRRHLAAGVMLYNAFDERVDVYNNFPRFGRAVLLTFAITR